jgi:hypothetical protein
VLRDQGSDQFQVGTTGGRGTLAVVGPFRPNGPGERSPELRPQADALGKLRRQRGAA